MARFKRKKVKQEGKVSRRPHPILFVKRHASVIGRVLIVLLGLALCILPPILLNTLLGYLPLLSYVIALLLSFVYLQVLKRSLTYSEDSMLPSCERGSEIEFVVTFKNRSPLIFLRLEPHFYISDLFGEVDTEIPASMTLMPFENRDFRFQAEFEHIGTYSAGVSKIVISDLLGLFSHTIVNPNRHMVEVLPKLFDVTKVSFSHNSSQESRRSVQSLISDDLDYAGVRDYEIGDPLKSIHWNLSARTPNGEYLTRLFETTTNPGLDIIIDTTSPKYSNEQLMYVFDGVVESALSVNDFAHQNGVDSLIRFINRDGDEARVSVLNVTDFSVLTDRLPRICAAKGDRALEILRREGNSIHGQSNLAYCTAHLDEGIISSMITLKMRKRNPILLLVVPKGMDEDERKEFLRPLNRLSSAQVTYCCISSAGELGEGE